MRNTLLFVIVLTTLATCSTNSPERDIRRVYGEQIVMPSTLRYVSGALLEYGYSDDALATLLIWYDSTQCSGCKLSGINSLEHFVKFCKDTVTQVNVDIVFSPPFDVQEAFEDAVTNVKLNYPIYIDFIGAFAKQNRKLPKTEQLHTFLLDANGRVVLVGDPTHNPKMWNLYKKNIKILCNNNGILP